MVIGRKEDIDRLLRKLYGEGKKKIAEFSGSAIFLLRKH